MEGHLGQEREHNPGPLHRRPGGDEPPGPGLQAVWLERALHPGPGGQRAWYHRQHRRQEPGNGGVGGEAGRLGGQRYGAFQRRDQRGLEAGCHRLGHQAGTVQLPPHRHRRGTQIHPLQGAGPAQGAARGRGGGQVAPRGDPAQHGGGGKHVAKGSCTNPGPGPGEPPQGGPSGGPGRTREEYPQRRGAAKPGGLHRGRPPVDDGRGRLLEEGAIGPDYGSSDRLRRTSAARPVGE